MNILIISFNRPDLIRDKILELSKIKNLNIYFFNDGPRIGNTSDKFKIQDIKSILNEYKDCIIEVYFNNINLGCKNGVITAINWFFSYVDNGIILEDDVFATEKVLIWMNNMLVKFENDNKCYMITGQSMFNNNNTYCLYKSYVPSVWGWATWKDKWVLYNTNFNYFILLFKMLKLNYTLKYSLQILLTLRLIANNKQDAWSTHLIATLAYNKMYCISPSINLIKNIGFNSIDSTHTFSEPLWYKYDINLSNKFIESKCEHNINFLNSSIMLKKIWNSASISTYKLLIKFILSID